MIAVSALLITMTDWTMEKKFVRIFQRIKPGMTEQQVRKIMGGFAEGTGRYGNSYDERGGTSESDDELGSRTTWCSGRQPMMETPTGEW